jgi:alpha-L-rhamnosidase
MSLKKQKLLTLSKILSFINLLNLTLMKTTVLLSLLILTPALFSQDLEISELTCEYLTTPVGIDCHKPRLSWKIKTSERNMMQKAYSIRVSKSPSFTGNLVWKSGKINSSESNLVPYKGPDLKATQRYYWQVKIWDNNGNQSDWSPSTFWEMGILNTDEWKAKWIEPVQDTLHPNGPVLTLRKDFSLTKDIVRARVYVTAHGLYELHLNGQKVGKNLFTPGWTVYPKRLQYQVYDITGMIRKGQNTVGSMLGEGWYKGIFGYENKWGHYGKKVGLLCQLEIEYADGTKETIATDGSWKATKDGPITMNSIYNGEIYNAMKELSGWDQPGYNDARWKPVNIADYSLMNLVASESVPVREIQELKPVKIWTTPKGTLVADMGQNMVGWVRLRVQGPAGTTITLRHAEVLDKYGEVYTDNLRTAKATIRYTLKGDGIETYEPRFTFMGFRYVAVEGFPGELKPDNLTGIVIHSDMKPTGTFECSDSLIDQLQHNIQWGQKGNFLDIPTDCPQRDERLGWTGDAQVFMRTASFNMDVVPFFSKWLKDLDAEQDDRGAVPFTIPNILGDVSPSAGWSDVATIAPWTIYRVFGDKRLLEQQYPVMKKYVDYIRKVAGTSYIWKGGSIFGDWLFYKPASTNWTQPDGYTDKDLIATAFFGYSTKILIRAAKELGKEDDVKEYAGVFDNIKKAFNENFVTPAGQVLSNSQTSYVLALQFDLLPDSQKTRAVKYLVQHIRDRNDHLSTGFLGTPYICHVLSDNGYTDLAYNLLLQQTYPSWLYPVKMGATTIWERWDGIKPDSTFQNDEMNSFNHYAYGAIGDWMYQVVAGIRIGAPGYKRILICPQPDPRLNYAKATYESEYGEIESGWKFEDGGLKVNVTIPPNTTAEITLIKTTLANVKESGKPITQTFKNAKEEDGNVILEAGSGKYTFTVNKNIL